jgi:hypothetical protein
LSLDETENGVCELLLWTLNVHEEFVLPLCESKL